MNSASYGKAMRNLRSRTFLSFYKFYEYTSIYDHLNVVTIQDCYSLILAVGCTTLKLKVFMKILVKIELITRKTVILITIQNSFFQAIKIST